MPRLRRAAAVAAGTLATAALLTACDKPPPKVTVLGGGKVVTISPSTYCWDAKHCPSTSKPDVPTLTVAADAKVLIDVPRQVQTRGWQARALSLDGQQQLGSSGPITDSHSYKVPSGVANGAAFIVQVNELSKGQPDGSAWSFLVKVSLTKS
jgi:hypothetical protein